MDMADAGLQYFRVVEIKTTPGMPYKQAVMEAVRKPQLG
jgi:hypothetical protein